MSATTVNPTMAGAPRTQPGFGKVLHAEWTKLRTVRSTVWSLITVVAGGVGWAALVTGITMASWKSTSASDKAQYLADPTGFLPAVMQFAQIPVCVLGVLVMSAEFSTGMIRSSVLAVPRRGQLLTAKVVVFALVTLIIGEVTGFASFFVGQRIAGSHLPLSLSGHNMLRAVAGSGLALALTGLMAVAIGTLIRHSAGAITTAIGAFLVLPTIAQLIPGSVGHHVVGYLPTEAVGRVMDSGPSQHAVLSAWQGVGVGCVWAVALLALAGYLLKRRDV
jgi:ABC-2 type transport system permease protein